MDIIVERIDEVDVVTLNRPEARNALTLEAYSALTQAIETSQARCIVVTGSDPAFCTGDDVRELMGTDKLSTYLEETTELHPATRALVTTEIPVVAAVNGIAVGWGMELALMADIRIASERARFGELFVQRGLCPDAAGFVLLAQSVGRGQAARLLFTGQIIDAEEASRIGLVEEVVSHDRTLARAMELAQAIAANPPLAVRRIKAGMRRALDPDWREFGAWVRQSQSGLSQTKDHAESIRAFLEKRPGRYAGN